MWMQIGMTENTVLRDLHIDAQDLFNVCCDLRKVCQDLNDPSVRPPRQVRGCSNKHFFNQLYLCLAASTEQTLTVVRQEQRAFNNEPSNSQRCKRLPA